MGIQKSETELKEATMQEYKQKSYKEKHRFCNQKNVIDGIPIDPLLRDDFDFTDNEERPKLEISDWWGKPFIRTDTWDVGEETYEEYFARSREPIGFDPETLEEWTARVQKQKESWFESFPSGTRYMVRCLDGGAWDRSTNKGSYPSIKEALVVAKSMGYDPLLVTT